MVNSEIESLIGAFEACTLPASEWTHEKHLIVALWYLIRQPREEATCRIREGIQRYNLSKGNATGYHETITLAWIAVIANFLAARDRQQPIDDLAEDLLAACDARDYLLRFYSRDRLFSPEARHHWVEPDLQPLEPAAKAGSG